MNRLVGQLNDVVFVTLIATGFAVGFLHAVIPTHWLPFVVAARAQRWNKTKTLTITGFAGAGDGLPTEVLLGAFAAGAAEFFAQLSILHELVDARGEIAREFFGMQRLERAFFFFFERNEKH